MDKYTIFQQAKNTKRGYIIGLYAVKDVILNCFILYTFIIYLVSYKAQLVVIH